MKIGLDATLFKDTHFTGISRSVHEILRSWALNHPEHEYYLLSFTDIHLEFELPSNWHKVIENWIVPQERYWWWFQRRNCIKKLGLDIFWGTTYALPRLVKDTAYVVTIYDMALFKFKNIGDPASEKDTINHTKVACKRADNVIAISKATANDIHEILGTSTDKISISYCGGLPSNHKLNHALKPDNDLLNFNEKFFLFISTLEPRKNIITIIHAFEKFVERNGTSYKLVLAGRKGWRSESIFEVIENSPYKDLIVIPGFISNNDKGYLLNNAVGFVYPSLYEGFGIPILEAYAYNLPVITTRISSLPEVAGDVGFYIETADDINGLANHMESLISLSDDERIELEQKMKNQLNKFSWDKNADEMLHVFEKIKR